jgi:hypothetical protein
MGALRDIVPRNSPLDHYINRTARRQWANPASRNPALALIILKESPEIRERTFPEHLEYVLSKEMLSAAQAPLLVYDTLRAFYPNRQVPAKLKEIYSREMVRSLLEDRYRNHSGVADAYMRELYPARPRPEHRGTGVPAHALLK